MIPLRLRKHVQQFFIMAMLLAAFQSAHAQLSLPLLSGCGWPFKTTPSTLNVMYPDANAVYWTTPFITLPGSQLTIDGKFFPARFLSINTYDTLGESINSTYDIKFPLDPGSNNPFTDESASPSSSFHITIKPDPNPFDPNNPPQQPSPDTLFGPPVNQYGFSQGYVVIRAYIPVSESQKQLPNITISLNGFKLSTVPPCANNSNSLRLLLYNALVRYWDGNVNAPGESDPPAQPMFRPPSPKQANGAFPNDLNKYIVTGMTYQTGRLVVIRGKAPLVPMSNSSGYPTLGGEQLRYWSICNYDQPFPFPVVQPNGCAADYQTKIDSSGYYTYVIAAKADIPTYNDPNATLVNWGATAVKKAVLFRNMLPTGGFAQTTQAAQGCQSGDIPTDAQCTQKIMLDYYPNAIYCAKSVYDQGGWQACFPPQQPKQP